MPPANSETPRLPRSCYILEMRQQPQAAKAMGSKPQDRKPVDPPPIINMVIKDPKDPTQNWLQSPYFMVVCQLWHVRDDLPAEVTDTDSPPLAGTICSSLHKLKDVNNQDGGFFIFGDVSVRPEGEYRLRFVLFEMLQGESVSLASIITQPFTVYPAKSFPGLQESSFLSRSFGDQGVRLRIRKDGRSASKRNAKSQHVGEEGGYEAKSQPNSTPNSQQSMYGDSHGYSRSFGSSDQVLAKRQRTSNDLGQLSFDRDAWYSSAPSSAGIYPPSTSSISTYSQDVISAPQNLGYYRNNDSGLTQVPTSLYSRHSISDFPHGQQQLGYETRGFDPNSTSGMSYNDSSSYSSLNSGVPSDTLSPTSHTSQSVRSDYSQMTDASLRAPYRVTVPSNASGSSLLPLPLNNHSSTVPSSGAGQSSYGYNYADSSRFNPQSSAQPGMRTGYNGYQGHFPLQATYQST